jgi:hypothetical protein
MTDEFELAKLKRDGAKIDTVDDVIDVAKKFGMQGWTDDELDQMPLNELPDFPGVFEEQFKKRNLKE